MIKIIEDFIILQQKVVLSKELLQICYNELKDYDRYVIKATFDRVFYAPGIKQLLKRLGKTLSDRDVIVQQIGLESQVPRLLGEKRTNTEQRHSGATQIVPVNMQK